MALNRYVRAQVRRYAVNRAKKMAKMAGYYAAATGIDKAVFGRGGKKDKKVGSSRMDIDQSVAKPRVRTLGHGTAWKKVKRVKATRTQPKVGLKFKKKVEKVLDYDKPFGEYRYIADQQLRQVARDYYTYYQSDNNGSQLEFFTPRTIWDAASICFNNKAATPHSRNDMDSGTIGENIIYAQSIHVSNSYVEFDFKSTSAHVVNVEMYICTPKSNVSSQGYPEELVNFQTNQQGDKYYYQNGAGTTFERSLDFVSDLGTKNGDWAGLHKNYKVTKVTLKFNPGESKRHFLQGPKNFTVDGTKFQRENGQLLQWSTFGRNVFFRVINDPTVCGQADNVLRQTVGQWNSNVIGGVAMRYTMTTRVRMPETCSFDTTNLAALNATNQYQRRNWVVVGNWIKTNENDRDQQVVVMNPIAVAANNN